jgi:hypothetical protein
VLAFAQAITLIHKKSNAACGNCRNVQCPRKCGKSLILLDLMPSQGWPGKAVPGE